MERLSIKTRVRVDGIVYEQKRRKVKPGDMVVCIHNGQWGVVDEIYSHGKRMTVRACTRKLQVGVILDDVRVLIPSIETNSLN